MVGPIGEAEARKSNSRQQPAFTSPSVTVSACRRDPSPSTAPPLASSPRPPAPLFSSTDGGRIEAGSACRAQLEPECNLGSGWVGVEWSTRQPTGPPAHRFRRQAPRSHRRSEPTRRSPGPHAISHTEPAARRCATACCSAARCRCRRRLLPLPGRRGSPAGASSPRSRRLLPSSPEGTARFFLPPFSSLRCCGCLRPTTPLSGGAGFRCWPQICEEIDSGGKGGMNRVCFGRLLGFAVRSSSLAEVGSWNGVVICELGNSLGVRNGPENSNLSLLLAVISGSA